MAYGDLPAFWAKLAEIDTTASRALMFVILTCARTSEVLHATWDEVSVRRRGLARSSQPNENAKAARRAAQRNRRCASWAIRWADAARTRTCSRGRPRQPLSTMALACCCGGWASMRRFMGFDRSARSWMADQGVAFELAEACLAHTTSGVVAAYQRSPMLERRRAD